MRLRRTQQQQEEDALWEKVIARLEAMTLEEQRALATRAGIFGDNGELTKQYGGTEEYSAQYRPVFAEPDSA